MNPFIQLAQQRPLIFVHLLAAVAALGLGAWLLLRRPRGDTPHRRWGWAWVLAMGTAALTSAFIRDVGLPNIAGFTPIHLLTLLVAFTLPRAVLAARSGRIAAHRQAMKSLYAGGCIVAGLFTLMPGRFLGHLLWHNWLGVA